MLMDAETRPVLIYSEKEGIGCAGPHSAVGCSRLRIIGRIGLNV
jgi:hypothetical protein